MEYENLEQATIRDRDEMYKLVIAQLLYDGQGQIGKNIANMAKISEIVSPSNLLCTIVLNYLKNKACK